MQWDSIIYRHYSKKILEWNWNWDKENFAITSDSKFLSSTLEAFFGRLQYEFREDLTQKNLDNWVHYWNFEKEMSALKGKTPASIYYSDYLQVPNPKLVSQSV